MAPRTVNLALLALTTALGVVGMSLGINALVQSFRDKDKVAAVTPAGVTVDIDDTDVVSVGAVLTVGCGLLALATFLSLLLALFRKSPSRNRLQAGIIGFLTLWVFVTAIATLVIARNRHAQVSAFLGGAKLPDTLVAQKEKEAGVSRVYWDHDYLRSAVIVPFVVFFLGALTTISLFTTRGDGTAAPVRMREKVVSDDHEGSKI